jgi:hypothetical protein
MPIIEGSVIWNSERGPLADAPDHSKSWLLWARRGPPHDLLTRPMVRLLAHNLEMRSDRKQILNCSLRTIFN